MRSVRLGKELEARLSRAVRKTGLAASEIIRQGVDERVSVLLGENLAVKWADVIGRHASGKPGVSRRTGRAFADVLRDGGASRGGRTTSRRRKAG